MEQGTGGDVDALGDLGVLVADQLGAEQPAGLPVAGQAQHGMNPLVVLCQLFAGLPWLPAPAPGPLPAPL